MDDDPRVQHLINELANWHATPQEVCKVCPDLLPTVRDQWRRMRLVRDGLDAMSPPKDRPPRSPADATVLP